MHTHGSLGRVQDIVWNQAFISTIAFPHEKIPSAPPAQSPSNCAQPQGLPSTGLFIWLLDLVVVFCCAWVWVWVTPPNHRWAGSVWGHHQPLFISMATVADPPGQRGAMCDFWQEQWVVAKHFTQLRVSRYTTFHDRQEKQNDTFTDSVPHRYNV